jgi:hypothetical protein
MLLLCLPSLAPFCTEGERELFLFGKSSILTSQGHHVLSFSCNEAVTISFPVFHSAQPSSHQDTLDNFDEQEIDQYCSRKEEEVHAGQWHEFERHGQRSKWKNQAERHNREHRDCQRQAWATAEWVARGADDK